jgi:hypothetical protein
VLAKGYRYNIGNNNESMQGLYYEMVIHQWFSKTDNRPAGISRVCWSEGSGVKCVQQLNETGMYWIPSVPNFANIDAAAVHEDTLHAFQYTIRNTHDFKKDTFTSFLSAVWESNSGKKSLPGTKIIAGTIQKVMVHFVSPSKRWVGPGREGDSSTYMFTYGEWPEYKDYPVTFHCHCLDLSKDVALPCSKLFTSIFDGSFDSLLTAKNTATKRANLDASTDMTWNDAQKKLRNEDSNDK